MSDERFLGVRDGEVFDRAGNPVLLRGFGLGGWMKMENFITGYPANEEAMREAMLDVLGREVYEMFFDRFLEHFFAEDDARFVASLGLNCLRLPVNYRHLEDDAEPFVVKEEGFRHLDRVVDLCARHGIYTIIDLHALPGYQNQDWHSDNPTHRALFWKHRHFQDRAVNLWEAIADRYRGNPWVAGYDPINEPADVEGETLMPVYERLFRAIRAVDPDHILFLEGNRYSMDFHVFGEPWENVVYANHDYADPGFADGGPYPGVSCGRYVDRDALEETFLERSRYMLEHGVPVWVGEFGPVYPPWDPEGHATRYRVLRDQLEIYDRYRVSWSVWTYKDIGLQGVVHAAPGSPYVRRIRPVLEKKARLGVDFWGSVDTGIRDVMEPVERLFEREYSGFEPFPFGRKWWVDRIVRHVLLAEPMVREFAECFRDMGESEVDEAMISFRFENCVRREELAAVLAEHARLPSSKGREQGAKEERG
jgi:endoglucanase